MCWSLILWHAAWPGITWYAAFLLICCVFIVIGLGVAWHYLMCCLFWYTAFYCYLTGRGLALIDLLAFLLLFDWAWPCSIWCAALVVMRWPYACVCAWALHLAIQARVIRYDEVLVWPALSLSCVDLNMDMARLGMALHYPCHTLIYYGYGSAQNGLALSLACSINCLAMWLYAIVARPPSPVIIFYRAAYCVGIWYALALLVEMARPYGPALM